MIREGEGNLLAADVEALVNTVNTVGVMGKGIALQFKQAYPENFKAYRAACKHNEVQLGRMFVFDTQQLGPRRYVINFPTKRHWKGKSRLSDIQDGLRDLVRVVRELGIHSLAMPAVGCGNGGLEWSAVEPLIATAFRDLPDVDVLVFAPVGTPTPSSMPVRTARPDMTQGRAAIIALIHGYVQAARAERVEAEDGASLLEIQKLAYLLQAQGQPMKLRFDKALYGPYADNLNHALQAMEGHYIRGYGDRTQRVLDLEPIRLMPGAVDAASEWLTQDPGLRTSIQAVLEMIDGFASPYGLELLTSVHWVAHDHFHDEADVDEVVEATQRWSRRKAALFTESHVKSALRRLTEEGLAGVPA